MPDVRVATLNLFNNAAGRWDDRADLVVPPSRAEDVHAGEPDWTHLTPLVEIVDPQAAFGMPVLPAHGAGRTIDDVFVSAAIEVADCRVCFDQPAAGEPQLDPSDHLGLVADLRLP